MKDSWSFLPANAIEAPATRSGRVRPRAKGTGTERLTDRPVVRSQNHTSTTPT